MAPDPAKDPVAVRLPRTYDVESFAHFWFT